jgi:hypothetical protein
MDLPETRYARARDGTRLAYKVLGDGPVDLVYLQPWYSHIEIISPARRTSSKST